MAAILSRPQCVKRALHMIAASIDCPAEVVIHTPLNAVSLAPGRSWCDFKTAIFNLVLLIGIFKSSYDNLLRWMPRDFAGDKSKLVQVMAWCRQATSHYLNQCLPRSPTPYGVTRPQWVKKISGLMQYFDVVSVFLWAIDAICISMALIFLWC